MKGGLPGFFRWLSITFVLACQSPKGHGPEVVVYDSGPGDAQKPDAKEPRAIVGYGLDGGSVDDALPTAISEELTGRAMHLLEAITQGNADLASDILFPRDAYLSARDASDAGRTWDRRIREPFRRQVLRLSKKKDMAKAKFISFDLGRALLQVTPRKRGWKKPLWVVRHSKLVYTIEGKTQRLDIAEMTSWRGAWYVTRLR